jgi:2-methylcitrate dehydratase PrpD
VTAPGASRRESAALSDWACSLRWDDVPPSVRVTAGLHFADAFGVAVASSATPFGARLLASLPEGATGLAWVIGSDRRVDSLRAALVNGTLVHGLEYDDTHIPSVIHGSAVALAAVLSQAHRDGVTTGDVLAAFVVAWEVMVRLGLLAPGAYQARGFQTAAVCGAPAAALAVGRLRGVSPPILDEAFAVATSFASGLMAYAADGATVKRAHLGWAAHGGVAAIELAEAGATGPTRAVTAKNGFLDVLAGVERMPDVADTFGDIGRRWHLEDASYKLHPLCHYLHGYVDLVAELRTRHAVADIGAVECEVHPAVTAVISDDEDQRRRPRTFEEAQYSLHYTVAQMFVHGGCTIEQLQEPSDPVVLEVAERVSAVVNPELEFPGLFPAVIRLRGHDGRMLEQASIPGPHGATASQADLIGELREKFVGNTASRWSQARAGSMFAQLSSGTAPAEDALVERLLAEERMSNER